MEERIENGSTGGTREARDPIGSSIIREGLHEILDKSCSLMAKKGFHGTSMRDLAQATGRSLAGLYHYFRSKQDLLFLINYHGFTKLNETWRKMDKAFDAPLEKLYAFIFFHTKHFVEHMNEMRVMTWGTQELNLEKARIIQKLKDSYTRGVMKVVGDAHGALTGAEIEQNRLSRETYVLFGMMNWMFSWYSPEAHGGAEELIGDIYQTFVYGLSRDAGKNPELERMRARMASWYSSNGAESMW